MGIFDWLRRGGGPEGTASALRAAYEAGRANGLPESAALLGMLSTRPRWAGLPASFLEDVVGHLGDPESLASFVVFSEQYGILENNIQRIAEKRECIGLAKTFTGLGIDLGRHGSGAQAEAAFKLALRLDPEWFPALSSLGTLYHLDGRHAEAVEYFERFFHLAGEAARRSKESPEGSEDRLKEPEKFEAATQVIQDAYRTSLEALGRGEAQRGR
jgi:tetratricopeptide (TPR) repeat protein